MIEHILFSISHFYPELILTGTLCVIIIADLFQTEESHTSGWIFMAGLVISGIALLFQYDLNTSVFYDMLAIDPFANFFKILLILSAIFIILFSMNSRELNAYSSRIAEYYMMLNGMVLGMFLMVSSSNLLMMYLAFEMTSICSYVLAGFTFKSLKSAEASLKFILFGAVSSGVLLYGISLLVGMAGSTNFYIVQETLSAGIEQPMVLYLSLIMILAGLGFKIAVVPFHFWAPDVYEGAPTPFTAFLAVASKIAAFALLIRFFNIAFTEPVSVDSMTSWSALSGINWDLMLGILAAFAMVIGNLSALRQDNIKRMLAYSSIAHAGYILMGLVVLTQEGLNSILIYICMYLFMNLGAFYVVILFDNAIESESIEDYKGMGFRAPFAGVAMTIFLVALTGLPPTAGFIAKLYIFGSAISAGWIWLVGIAGVMTVISLFYYIRVVRNMYFFKPEADQGPVILNLSSRVVLLLLLIPTLVLGVYFTPIIEFAQQSIQLFGM